MSTSKPRSYRCLLYTSGLNMLSINYYYQRIAIGIVIIGAVYLDSIRSKRR